MLRIGQGGHKFVGYPKRIETIRANRIRASAFNSLAVLPSGKVHAENSYLSICLNNLARDARHSDCLAFPSYQFSLKSELL